MENAEFEYKDDFEAYEEEVEEKPRSFPPLPLMSSLAHTRNACDFSINTENNEISSFLDIILDESEPDSIDDSLGQKDEDTKTTGSREDAAKEKKAPVVRDTKKRTVTLCPRRTRDEPLEVSEIMKEGLAAPATTNGDEVVNLRIEILKREHRRSQVNNYTCHMDDVKEKPQVEEGAPGAFDYDRPGMEIMIKSLDRDEDVKSSTSVISNETTDQEDVANEENNHVEPEVEDGDAKETDLCIDPSLEYLEECTPLQVFYQPYPSDITLPVPVPEVKIKMVRLSRTVADILLRRTTPYIPPPERQGPKVWNTFQKVPEIDVQEKIDVDTKKNKPKKKSFMRRLFTFFRKRSAKVIPVSS